MKTLMTGFSFMLCISITLAQSSLGKQVNDAKFQIVKKTAEFLSTDKGTFGNKVKNKCEGCATYDDVKKYAGDNKLTNVNALVSKYQNITVDTVSGKWKASLTTFKDNILDEITSGSDNKIARKKLPGYQTYTNSLNTIISNIKATEADHTASAFGDDNTATQKPEPAVAKAGDTTQKIKAPQQQVVPDEEAAPEASLLDKAMPWLPYIIAGVLLLLLFAVWRSSNENKKKITTFEKDKKDLESKLTYLKKDNTDLQLKIKVLEAEVKNKEIDLQATEVRLRNAEGNNKNAAQSNVSEVPAIEKPAAKISVQKPKPVVANIKYARYADMGDGFSNAELLNKADGETIFELVIMPNNNTGEFKVASHAAAQHYALSNAQYFLGKTCQYNSFPSEDATIQTDAPGTIKLTGSTWTIVSPAKISFS